MSEPGHDHPPIPALPPAYQPYAPRQPRPDLDLPKYGIGFGEAVRRGFAKYARFDGRASRSEFWWWRLAIALYYLSGLAVVLAVAATREAGVESSPPAPAVAFLLLWMLGLLALVVPSLALFVRRLHDAELSGWVYLIVLFPYLGGLVLHVLALLKSKPGGARYDRGATPAGPYPAHPGLAHSSGPAGYPGTPGQSGAPGQPGPGAPTAG